jgi:hypothetical protein
VKEQKRQGKEQAPPTKKHKADDLSFVPSSKFIGAKKGMVFKSGPKGLGYYTDVLRPITYKGAGQLVSNRQRRLADKEEEDQRRKMMMSGKARRLHGKMEHGIQRKRDNARQLMERRQKR